MKEEPHSTSTRRQFVKTAGAAGAALAAGCSGLGRKQGSRSTLAAAPAAVVKKDEPIRMGIIGTGGMGGGHLHAFCDFNTNGQENVQLVALADVCKPRLDGALQAAQEKQPGVEVTPYRDYHDLLAREDIHGVLIASPEHWHWKHSIDAIRAGKDVYCEKPMTLRLDEAMEVRKVVKDSDRVFTVGTQHITQKKYGEARRLIAEGAIGTVVTSQTSYCRNSKDGEWNYYSVDPLVKPGEMLDWEAWCGPQPVIPFDTLVYHRWRRYKDWSTGIVGDLLVHMMSPLFWALDLGYPSRVTGCGENFVDMAMDNHDQVFMTVEFDKPKHQLYVMGSTDNEYGLDTNIRGHKGTIWLNSGNCVMRPERIYSDEIDEQVVNCPEVRDQDEMRLNWLHCIRTRETPLGHVDLAMKVMVAVDLATRSMWEGKAWHFDEDKMQAVVA